MLWRECRFALAVPLALSLAACSSTAPEAPQTEEAASPRLHSERGGIGALPLATRAQALTTPTTVETRRSLVVTEQAIVSQFTLKEVMDRLAAQSGVAGMTGLRLFRQLWDTQNGRPGITGVGPHCDDTRDAANRPLFNSYPYACRPAEGSQAAADPFTDPNSSSAYRAVGLFNRFDLAPADGADCGEHRIVFAKNPGGGRNFMIFEAVLPNPQPALGLEGCLPVAEFWADLTTDNDLNSRITKLRNFYFNGLPGFMPVVHIQNYGAVTGRTTGQIRTNQFMGGNWNLREYKLQHTCSGGTCTALTALIATDKTNPFGGLFNPTNTHPLRADFQNIAFPGQVAALAVNDINLFNYAVEDRFNSGQSDAQAFENDYIAQFGSGGTFRQRIQDRLTAQGSTLTPEHIVRRAEALSCAGCHQFSNGANLGGGIVWPSSMGFTHISEFTESGPEGPRFSISGALTGVFLPHRKAVLEDYLNKPRACHDVCTPGAPLRTSCSPCAAAVCEGDPFCCSNQWDATCVDQAADICGTCG